MNMYWFLPYMSVYERKIVIDEYSHQDANNADISTTFCVPSHHFICSFRANHNTWHMVAYIIRYWYYKFIVQTGITYNFQTIQLHMYSCIIYALYTCNQCVGLDFVVLCLCL